jgi:putative oxidoreductase
MTFAAMGLAPPDLMIDARTAIRVVCGLFFLPHTIAKLSNIKAASEFFDRAGFRPPRLFVVLTALLEITAAFGLISGLYPRLAALIAAGILIVAASAIARLHTLMWRWQHPGIEYMLFWAIMCLCAGFLPDAPH